MSLLNDFPFEVLSLIFQKTWELYLLDHPPLKKEPRRIFPFNAASVCSLWLDVLKSEPQYWKCVTFDVGYDPTLFLETIGLYASGGIDVCVVSSRRSKVTELQEKSVVQKLYTHLKPHLPICSAIEFDLVFQSSLPSAADILTHDIPCLSSLSFRCEVHNCDDNSLDIKINANKKSRKKNPRSLTFPALRRLCLTGYSFMELRQLGEKWAEISVTDLPQSSLHLSVNHFKFHEPGQWDDRTWHSSLYVFLQTIELWTEYKNFELVLQDISTDYRTNADHGQRSMSFTSIKFKDVSRDFISTFFGSFSAPSWRQLATVHFMGCSIPCIPKCAWSQTTTLIVGYTPFRRCSRSRSNIEERLSDSLCNAVFAFHPEHLLVRGCEELGDAFFDWYCSEMRRYPSYYWRITSLDIAHCKEFSASALCKFVQRCIVVLDRRAVPSIRKLCVKGGQNTLLKKFDAQWFLDKKSYIHVDWTVSYEGEVGEEYLKTFHTHE